MGVPGTSGFPAELLLIIGALNAHPGLGVAALLGAILGAAYMLSFMRRAFFGPVVNTRLSQIQDLRAREFGLLCIPALLVLFFGFFPDLVLDINKVAAESWLSRLITVTLSALGRMYASHLIRRLPESSPVKF